MLHLYASYLGRGGPSAVQQLGAQIHAYERAGFEIEVALCYRPEDGGSAADVAGFVEFVRAAIRSLGPARQFVSAQVTNEANVAGSPSTSDGYYKEARSALIDGVIAAKAQVQTDHLRQLRVGFNWAYDTGSGERGFWRALRVQGGRRFLDALDWVGIDASTRARGGRACKAARSRARRAGSWTARSPSSGTPTCRSQGSPRASR